MVKQIHDISGYLSWIDSLYADFHTNGRPLFFRGHADDSWVLLPGVFRKDDYYERGIILDYKQVLSPEPDYFSRMERMLVEMQHHLIPTRLLDWSISPLISLYFACQSHLDKDASIYCLNPWKAWKDCDEKCQRPTYYLEIMKEARLCLALGWSLEEVCNFIKRKYGYSVTVAQLETPLSIVGRYMDNRVVSQQGCFVIWGYQKTDLRMFPEYRNNMREIRISKDDKTRLLLSLKRLGISNFTVFRDYEGFSKDVRSTGSVFRL